MARKQVRSPKTQRYELLGGGAGFYRDEDVAEFRALPPFHPGDMPAGAWDRVWHDGYLRICPGVWARWDGRGDPRETTLEEAEAWFDGHQFHNVRPRPGSAQKWEVSSGLPPELVRDMRRATGEIRTRRPNPKNAERDAGVWKRHQEGATRDEIASEWEIKANNVDQILYRQRRKRKLERGESGGGP